MPNWWQAFIWTNTDPIHWRIFAALGGDELMAVWSLSFDSLIGLLLVHDSANPLWTPFSVYVNCIIAAAGLLNNVIVLAKETVLILISCALRRVRVWFVASNIQYPRLHSWTGYLHWILTVWYAYIATQKTKLCNMKRPRQIFVHKIILFFSGLFSLRSISWTSIRTRHI